MRIALLVLGLLVCATAVNALLLVSRFSFGAGYFRARAVLPGFAEAGLVGQRRQLILVIAGLVVFLIYLNSRPLLRIVEQKFTVQKFAEQNFTVPA